jgi:phage I-like protein
MSALGVNDSPSILFRPAVGFFHAGTMVTMGGRESRAVEKAVTVAAPEWIELLPAGRFNTRDGRGPFVLENPDAVVAATLALRMEAGLPIDYDHATDFGAPHGAPAPAAGWIRELAVRDGAIWGRVEWTVAGAAQVAGREYRYVSPVFEFSKDDNRVTRILRAALTNNPALYGTAIASRMNPRTAEAEKDGKGASMASQGKQAMTAEELRAALATHLGLADDASCEEILAAVSAQVAAHDDANGADGDDRAGGDEEQAAARLIAAGRVVSSADYAALVGEVNALKAGHSRERAERAVEEAIRGGKLLPAHREWAIAYCARDERGFGEFVARQPAILRGADERVSGNPPRGARALEDAELAICAALGIRPDDYAQNRSRFTDGIPTVEQRRN